LKWLGFFKGSLEIGDKFFINKNVGRRLLRPLFLLLNQELQAAPLHI
jgi:hypothetical protein